MKKGFVFIETITVLMVLVTVLLSVFLSYQNITSNIDKREYYDNISDIYKTNIIRKRINLESLDKPGVSYISMDTSNCAEYMDSNCASLLEDLDVDKIYINLEKIGNVSGGNFPNTLKDYLKTIETSRGNAMGRDEELFKRMIIVNYKYRDHNYYASLDI